jgi:uncharacterized protein (DUF1810 family)
MATFCGIASLHEARAYLAHPVLGPRLELCTRMTIPRSFRKFASARAIAEAPHD